MILLIHNRTYWMLEFLTYLEKNQISHCDLTIHELVNHVEIIDGINLPLDKIVWQNSLRKIKFSEVTGIYHEIGLLSIDYFNRYHAIHREYAREEWLAYLLYRFNNIKNIKILNPLTPNYLAGILNLFPYMYDYAKKVKFQVPNYCLLNQCHNNTWPHQKHKIIGKTNLSATYSFEDVNKITPQTLALIEYIEGAPIFVFIIDQRIFSSILYKEGLEIFKLPSNIEQQCFALSRQVNTPVCEINLHRTINNQYYFYGFSLEPNWQNCLHEKDKLYAVLTNFLQNVTPQAKKRKKSFMKPFILKKFRKKPAYTYLNPK